MSTSADERWLADARARAASGQWERDADTIYTELRRQSDFAAANRTPQPGCPACDGHPEMQTFPRYELLSADPFLYCQRCYGFWAVGDALDRGVADPGYVHPALEAVLGPRRCRRCFGHLKPDDTCAKCGEAPAALNCPLCAQPMDRFEQAGIDLDQCGPCRGTWFDTGEIVHVYKLQPVQGWAMSQVDEHAPDGVRVPWLLVAEILARLLLRAG